MCMLSDWAAEKKVLFDSALPDTALPGPAGQLAAASITAPYSPQQFRSTLPAGAQAFQHPGICICMMLFAITTYAQHSCFIISCVLPARRH